MACLEDISSVQSGKGCLMEKKFIGAWTLALDQVTIGCVGKDSAARCKSETIGRSACSWMVGGNLTKAISKVPYQELHVS